jgi:hypothetical protein
LNQIVRTGVKIGLFLILLLVVIELTLTEVFPTFSDDAVTVTSFKTEAELVNEQIPTLEMQLESKEKINGEIIETYREYEIHYDENGEVLKEIPTSNYNYIRYKEY